MSYDRRWLETVGSEDSHGRAVWSLGVYSAEEPECLESSLASELFAKSLEALENISAPRALAFSALGINAYLASNHTLIHCTDTFERIASALKRRHKSNATENWPWLENEVTYDNARIPQALILAGHRLKDQEMMSFGLDSLDWLMKIQTSDKLEYFHPVGCNGWFPKGGSIALFDQQPLEATAMIDACISAFDITQDPKWYRYSKTCFQWFLGDNSLQYSVYDPLSGGCKDGIRPNEINQNQGAESTLCWLLGNLAFFKTNPPKT